MHLIPLPRQSLRKVAATPAEAMSLQAYSKKVGIGLGSDRRRRVELVLPAEGVVVLLDEILGPLAQIRRADRRLASSGWRRRARSRWG